MEFNLAPMTKQYYRDSKRNCSDCGGGISFDEPTLYLSLDSGRNEPLSPIWIFCSAECIQNWADVLVYSADEAISVTPAMAKILVASLRDS